MLMKISLSLVNIDNSLAKTQASGLHFDLMWSTFRNKNKKCFTSPISMVFNFLSRIVSWVSIFVFNRGYFQLLTSSHEFKMQTMLRSNLTQFLWISVSLRQFRILKHAAIQSSLHHVRMVHGKVALKDENEYH